MTSLRQIAKELGVSHTLLVLWKQGKRSLAPELEARYHRLVTSGYKNGYAEMVTNRVGGCGLDTNPKGLGGDPPRNRTENLRIKSPLLYQLS